MCGTLSVCYQVWNTELEVVAQRWTDQCQTGHDSERCKLDGSPVGQNFWELGGTLKQDEVAVQAGIGGAAESWYNEVSNPGGVQGHYTQMVNKQNRSGRI